MSKYKLIKEYPNSPELGFITDETMYFPASYPEFWEEIVEKEWKIINYTAKSLGNSISHTYQFQIKQPWFGNSEWKVNSIKRLTDNTTFSIGDKIKCENSHVDKPEAITKIELNKEGTPCLFTNSFHNNGVNIFKAIKYCPILTTEDGVDLFKNDYFWHVDSYFGIAKGVLDTTHPEFKPIKGYKHFSTEKAAKEYIDLNKPRFSKKDLLDASANIQYGGWFIEGLIKRLNK